MFVPVTAVSCEKAQKSCRTKLLCQANQNLSQFFLVDVARRGSVPHALQEQMLSQTRIVLPQEQSLLDSIAFLRPALLQRDVTSYSSYEIAFLSLLKFV